MPQSKGDSLEEDSEQLFRPQNQNLSPAKSLEIKQKLLSMETSMVMKLPPCEDGLEVQAKWRM